MYKSLNNKQYRILSIMAFCMSMIEGMSVCFESVFTGNIFISLMIIVRLFLTFTFEQQPNINSESKFFLQILLIKMTNNSRDINIGLNFRLS